MPQAVEFYIGHFKLEVNNDAYLVEVSFVDSPPRQDKIKDLPRWTLSSKNAIWFVQEDRPILNRANNGEEIKKNLLIRFVQ